MFCCYRSLEGLTDCAERLLIWHTVISLVYAKGTFCFVLAFSSGNHHTLKLSRIRVTISGNIHLLGSSMWVHFKTLEDEHQFCCSVATLIILVSRHATLWCRISLPAPDPSSQASSPPHFLLRVAPPPPPAADTLLPHPPSHDRRSCVAPRVHPCAPVIPRRIFGRRVLWLLSTCLPSPDWLSRVGGIPIGGQRFTPSQSEWLCVLVLLRFTQTQDEASACMCMSVKFLCSAMSLKGRRFSLDSNAWVQIWWLWWEYNMEKIL